MSSPKVLVVCGSSRDDGRLEQLTAVAGDAARLAGAQIEQLHLKQMQLPVMVWGDAKQGLREDVARIRELAAWADGFIIGTPEYHGSMSGALKNWFDYLYNELAGKFAGVVATTGGGTGDMSITAVKNCFQWCHGFVLPFHAAATSAAFTDDQLSDAKVIDRVRRVGYDVVRFAPLVRGAFEQARGHDGPEAGVAGLH